MNAARLSRKLREIICAVGEFFQGILGGKKANKSFDGRLRENL